MKFSKAKMMERIEKAGLLDMVGETELAIMDNLDGQEASENCWERVTKGEPVLWVVGKDGKGEYVNELDCI